MWMLSIFYFLTIVIVCVLNQFNFPENLAKITLFVCLLVGLLIKRKIRNINAAAICMILFLVVAFYSAIRGLDFNYSWPLVIGFLALYLFVKSNVETLDLADLNKTVVNHSYIANAMIVLMLVGFCFFPSLIHKAPGNYHPYAGLAGVVGTSAAILLGAFVINVLAFFCFENRAAKLMSIIFAVLATAGIVILNARTTGLALVLWCCICYLFFITYLKDEEFKQSILKAIWLFLPLLFISGIAVYTFFHFNKNLILFHQTGDTTGIDFGGRAILWINSLKSFISSEYVWSGVGYGNHFYFLELNLLPYQTTHNILLDIAYGTGLVGLCFFLSFILLSMLDVMKQFFLTRKAIHFFILMALLALFIQSQGESSLDSLLTTNLYIYLLCYEIAMRLGQVKSD